MRFLNILLVAALGAAVQVAGVAVPFDMNGECWMTSAVLDMNVHPWATQKCVYKKAMTRGKRVDRNAQMTIVAIA
ncbi:uncharacterized protein N7483_011560 [Penicillium malachiteum]|uniref:uncharacterized protein n=1 Tax=Penicillium malachiteum TaxID=1324776 RepID=UPI0025480193|nr:uncharacterized protein N7483_011560 [Penicillium malachiteum]KAJ5714379.1 hypothetical protein N7483_011560 [Penicillium malachiteum]